MSRGSRFLRSISVQANSFGSTRPLTMREPGESSARGPGSKFGSHIQISVHELKSDYAYLQKTVTRIYLFPGQGSQKVGMGDGLFPRFPAQVAEADAILGYSIVELCLRDPSNQLNLTTFTQPALFVINALSFLNRLVETGE